MVPVVSSSCNIIRAALMSKWVACCLPSIDDSLASLDPTNKCDFQYQGRDVLHAVHRSRVFPFSSLNQPLQDLGSLFSLSCPFVAHFSFVESESGLWQGTVPNMYPLETNNFARSVLSEKNKSNQMLPLTLSLGAAKIVGFSSRSIKSIKASSEAGTEHLKDKTYLPFCLKMWCWWLFTRFPFRYLSSRIFGLSLIFQFFFVADNNYRQSVGRPHRLCLFTVLIFFYLILFFARMFEQYAIRELMGYQKGLYGIRWNKDGEYLGAICGDRSVRIAQLTPTTSLNNVEIIHTIPTSSTMSQLCWSSVDSQRLALCSDDKLIELWDIRGIHVLLFDSLSCPQTPLFTLNTQLQGQQWKCNR